MVCGLNAGLNFVVYLVIICYLLVVYSHDVLWVVLLICGFCLLLIELIWVLEVCGLFIWLFAWWVCTCCYAFVLDSLALHWI